MFPGGEGPDGGHAGELYEAVYARLPQRAWRVLISAAGTGKSAAMMVLLSHALAYRAGEDPVPG